MLRMTTFDIFGLFPAPPSIDMIRWNPSRSSSDAPGLGPLLKRGLEFILSAFGRGSGLKEFIGAGTGSWANNCRKRDARPVVGALSKNTDDAGAVLAFSSGIGGSRANRLSTSTILDLSILGCSGVSYAMMGKITWGSPTFTRNFIWRLFIRFF